MYMQFAKTRVQYSASDVSSAWLETLKFCFFTWEVFRHLAERSHRRSPLKQMGLSSEKRLTTGNGAKLLNHVVAAD